MCVGCVYVCVYEKQTVSNGQIQSSLIFCPLDDWTIVHIEACVEACGNLNLMYLRAPGKNSCS